MWWSDYWPMPLMFFAPAMMIIFVVVCLAMIFFMVRSVMGRRSRGRDALDILKERYARGEINQAEYEERRRFLGTT
jgi:putative membrane protein